MTERQELMLTRSESYLAEKWSEMLQVSRGRISRVWSAEPGKNTAAGLSAAEIKEFGGCVAALAVFNGNQGVLAEKIMDLLAVVGDICAYGQRNVVEAARHSLTALLEVFIKEALVQPPLKRLLNPSRLQNGKSSGIFSIQDLLLAHLNMAIPKEICINFTDSFCKSLVMSNASGNSNNASGIIGCYLGLQSTLSLLNYSLSYTMSYILQAHLAILASKCIETQSIEFVKGSGFHDAISAVELSAKLHYKSLCDLNMSKRSRPYLSRNAKESLTNKVPDTEIMKLLKPNKSGEIAQKDLYLLISSYIDEIQRTVHKNARLRTGNTLKSIVSLLLSDKELGRKGLSKCKITEELVTVAASTRLLASSLFRLVTEARSMLSHTQKSNKSKDIQLEAHLMNYMDINSNNVKFHLVGGNADRAARKILLDAISGGSSSRKRSVMLMQHFMKLMLLGLRSRMDFMWKACVMVLSAILNLMAFEGEEFDALKILSGDDGCDSVETTKGSTGTRKSKGKKQIDSSVSPDAKRRRVVDGDFMEGEGSHRSKDNTKKRSLEIGASDHEDLVEFFMNPPEDLEDFIDYSDDAADMEFYLKEREGLYKKRKSARVKKRQMLRRVLGMNIKL